MENNRCFGCMEEKQSHPICEHCGFDERQQNLPHQLPTGSILRGQYLIGRVLGQGGFGITYLGWDMYLDMPVAIKEFYPGSMVTRDTSVSTSVTSYAGNAQQYEQNKTRFMREAKALALFKDLQHIIQIHSFFPENNTVYLVMEYAKGHTLQKYLKENGPMALPQVLEILIPIMEDLQKVHEAEIIHRDISPDNIMLLDGGGVRLLDFGAVRQVENPDQEKQLSKSTEAILKQGFAPVEQYNAHGSLGPWTDVYAMCATICYCLNGKLPQLAPDRTIGDDPEHFIDILPITEAQKNVLRRGMALRPKDRTASMAELSRQLKESMIPERKPELSKPEPPAPELPAPERPRQVPPSPKPQKPEPSRQVPPKAEKTNTPVHTTSAPQKKKPLWFLWAGIGAVALALAVLLPISLRQAEPQPTEPSAAAVTLPAATEAPVPIEDLVLKNFDPEGKSECAFGTDIKKNDVVSIEFLDSLEGAPEDAVDVSKTRNGKVLLWAEPDQDGLQKLYIAGDGRVYFPENSSCLFGKEDSDKTVAAFYSLEKIIFSDAADTSRVTDMSGMFGWCESLPGLDVSSFDTSHVTDMSWMFSGCHSLASLDVSSFDTSQVTDMVYMFAWCKSLPSLDVSSFDTSQVPDMSAMFWDCGSLTSLDISSFDTSQVTNMNNMFGWCESLPGLDVSSFDTSHVKEMSCMFIGCGSLLSLDVSSFDTSQLTNMWGMFSGCSGLTEDALHTENPKIIDLFRQNNPQ